MVSGRRSLEEGVTVVRASAVTEITASDTVKTRHGTTRQRTTENGCRVEAWDGQLQFARRASTRKESAGLSKHGIRAKHTRIPFVSEVEERQRRTQTRHYVRRSTENSGRGFVGKRVEQCLSVQKTTERSSTQYTAHPPKATHCRTWYMYEVH